MFQDQPLLDNRAPFRHKGKSKKSKQEEQRPPQGAAQEEAQVAPSHKACNHLSSSHDSNHNNDVRPQIVVCCDGDKR